MAYSPYSPDYYTRGNIQVWDFIRDQGLSFHLGNAIKYICRAGHKDDYKTDLVKAIHYLRTNYSMSLLNTAIEFRQAYNIPNDLSRRNLQKNLIVEEFKEFLEADQEMTLMHPDDRANCLKELADLVYVCAQYAENMDWDLEQAASCSSEQYVKAWP